MRKFKFEQTNSTPFRGLDGTVILWDGTETNHHILIEAANGLGVPQSVVTTQQAPYQFGASPIRSTFAPRTITFDCAIAVDCRTATGRAQVETIRRDLAKKFSPVGMGFVQKTSALTSDYDTVTGKLSYASDGSTYDRFIDCVPIECNFVNREYKDGFQRFRLVLFCPDPAWYGAENQQTLGNVQTIATSTYYPMYSEKDIKLILARYNNTNFYKSSDSMNFQQFTGVGNVSNGRYDPIRSLYILTTDGFGPAPTSYYSYDGETYSIPNGIPVYPNGLSVVGYDNKYVYLFRNGYSTTYYRSVDGISYESKTFPANIYVSDVEYSKELNITVVTGIVSGSSVVYWSNDGETWTIGTIPVRGSHKITWCESKSKFIAIPDGGSLFSTSTDGKTFSGSYSDGSSGKYGKASWSNDMNILLLTSNITGEQYHSWSNDLITFTRVNETYSCTGIPVYIKNINAFSIVPFLGGNPFISYDGKTFVRQLSTDYSIIVQNNGDMKTEFEIDIPVHGGETGKMIVISDNFTWDGIGTPPTDHNLSLITDGLVAGIVTVSTKFNKKLISQFGVSKMDLYQQGTFFSLYVSGSVTNNIYVRNTGADAGAPAIRWKNRYLGV